MTISLAQLKASFTKTYLAAYEENTPAFGFLQSFFDKKTTAAKEVNIEVRRGTERIASDVERGVTGNLNKFSKSTEKVWIPPFYNEMFDITQLDRYDVGFNQMETASPRTIGYLAEDVGIKLATLKDKIKRAIEKMCYSVFETGVITLNDGVTTIDFKRKAGSMVDNSANPWSTAATAIENQLIAGCEWLRQEGKSTGAEFNMIMPGAIWVYLKASDYFTDNANYNQVKLIDINEPRLGLEGAAYHGTITAGHNIIHLWTYDEGYENSAGTWVPYLHAKKVVLLPKMGTRFDLAYAGVPAILADTSKAEYSQFIQNVEADFFVNNYIDPFRKAHYFEVLSAPLPIPVSVDRVYTMQVLA